MLKFLKYQTPSKYALEFKDSSSWVNLKQIQILSTGLFILSSSIRLLSTFFWDDFYSVPNIEEYNLGNIIQIAASATFIILSTIAIRGKNWKRTQRNFLTLAFTLFILGITFFMSYIYSQHNTKNTLTMFLIGIVVVSIFFSLEFKYIIALSLFVILLFTVGMIVPSLNSSQKLFNFIASVVLAFVLFICSRYSYFFKSQHLVQLKQLEEKNLEVQELNRQKGEILAFVAHDLRNPLNNIEALSRIILEENESEENTEVNMILGSAKQAKEIINDLIEVIQVEKSPFLLQNMNMVNYVNNICQSWQANAIGDRRINFITVEEELLSPVNPSKLNRVIDNLIGNGLKFSDSSKPIDVEVTKNENSCIIRVKDYGIGIPEHLRSMLFDQFSKAGRAGLKGEKSLGLGLHISKDIVEQHGGTLTMETEENIGSTFIISMPLAS